MNICPNKNNNSKTSLLKSVALAAILTAFGAAQANAQLHIIPQPVSAVEKEGSFALKASNTIAVDEQSQVVGNYLHQYLWDTYKIDLKVKVYSDSKYVVDAINLKWIVGWKKIGFKNKANVDLWQRFLRIYNPSKHEFYWVKGHASNVENNRCDQLAVVGSKLANTPLDEGYEAIRKG